MIASSVPAGNQGIRLIHRLIYLWYGISLDSRLNGGDIPAEDLEGGRLDLALSRLVKSMEAEAYDDESQSMDYSRLKNSDLFQNYLGCARRLQRFDPATLSSREERLAFWINIYNALIIDAVIQYGVTDSVEDIPGFFWRSAYNINGRRFCAFDLEYGILRANAGHPAIPGPHFTSEDPRRAYSLDLLDPRVHFALVCASRSCPPISSYEPKKIDSHLDLTTRSFVNGGGVKVNRRDGKVLLSKIFQWYAPDFGARSLALGDKQPLLEFVAKYLYEGEDRDYLLKGSPDVDFLPYDWRLNSLKMR
jgi:hypothetical protein